jgi:membrane protein insertase Oxa1/YidC/SpoIIIJ
LDNRKDEEYVGDEGSEEYEDLEGQTFLEKIQPFIIPICLTFFALVFAGLFLYFFSKSRIDSAQQAIVNVGVPEQVNYPPIPVPKK